MSNPKHFTTAAFLLLASCAVPSADDETVDVASSELSSWHAVLRCGGGGIVIDVDGNQQRRHLQAVIRDPNAVAYLSAHPGGAGASAVARGSWAPGVANEKGEVILDGFADAPVFTAHDFVGFRRLAFSVRDALLPEAYVERQGNGVKVRLVTWKSGHEEETANWFFPDCH